MPETVNQYTFPNGLTLLSERMDHVRSAAVNFLVPAGCGRDPSGREGLAGVVAELITRGAGDRDSRALMLAFDNLGIDRSESVGVQHMRFWGSTLATNVPRALELFADVLCRPHFPDDELEPVIDLAMQDLRGLEDEPASRLMVELRKRLYPHPLSNDHRGTAEGVGAIALEDVRAYHGRHFRPGGTILSVAGNVEWSALRDQVGRLLGDWAGDAEPPLALGAEPAGGGHVGKELEQTHLTVSYKSVPSGDPDYYQALAAVNVLSGGMGARLFTEIREKEGLCYSVSASFSPMKDRGAVVGYAASRNERAQRTLDKLAEEFTRMSRGVTAEEVDRVRVGLKTSLIMQQESTGSRAGSLASDWYNLGRVRSFDEIQAAIDGLTPASIHAHLERHPPADFRVVTLGPAPLRIGG
ncbi:MAG: M16 family metallopeptidase [Gemmataceae bacterium]